MAGTPSPLDVDGVSFAATGFDDEFDVLLREAKVGKAFLEDRDDAPATLWAFRTVRDGIPDRHPGTADQIAAHVLRHAEADAPEGDDVAAKAERAIRRIETAMAEGELVAVGFSGGKDSSVVLGLALQAALRLRDSGRDSLPLLVVSGDTGVENPAVQRALDENLETLRAFATREGLDVRIDVAKPNVANSYLVQIVGGRQLPTWVNSGNRSCSVSLKVEPGTRAVREAAKRIAAEAKSACADRAWRACHPVRADLARQKKAKPPLVLNGSRTGESHARARNMAKVGTAEGDAADSGHRTRSMSPISDWTVDDVWEWLAMAGLDAEEPFRAWRRDFDETVEIYRDSSGECPVVAGDNGPRSACGARHGCWICTASGERDRSLERMLESEKYAYMRDLNRLRNWLANARHRWDLRSTYKRSRPDGSDTLRAGAGMFSPETCAFLLRACLSIDLRELRRAKALKDDLESGGWGDAYLTALRLNGQPFDERYARRMVEPQFRLIDVPETIVAIDFYWSVNGMHRPFEALRILRDVADRGGEIDIPDLAPGNPADRPPERTVEAPGLSALDGLVDHSGETVAPEAFGARPYGKVDAMPHAEAQKLEIDREAAAWLVEWDLDYVVDSHETGHKPFAAAAFYLRNGVVRTVKGQSSTLDAMARRGQWVADNGGWRPDRVHDAA